jgi:hypothetical protein
MSGEFHAPAALCTGKSPRYPLDRRLCGPQSRSGRYGVERNSCICQESNPSRPARSLSLYRLSYSGSSVSTSSHLLEWQSQKSFKSDVKWFGELFSQRRPVSGNVSSSLHLSHMPGITSADGERGFNLIKRWSFPLYRPWRPLGLWEVEAPTFSRQSAHRWR